MCGRRGVSRFNTILDLTFSMVYGSLMDRTIRTREAIVAAAGRLFSARGYEATTMDEIAAAAGVAKGTLYRHFAGKEALRDLLAPRLPGADMQVRDARARLVEATMDLIARQGFARTSLEEIAAAAGVSKGAIYWHFKGKDDLMAAIVSDYSPFPRITALLQTADDAPFEEVMRRIYTAYLDFAAEHIAFLRAIFLEVQANPELAAIFQRNVLAPIFAALGGYLKRNASREELRPVHPILVIQALVGPLLLHLFTRDVLAGQFGLRLDRDEVTQTFLEIFFRGIRREVVSS